MLKYPTLDAGDASIVVLSEQYPKAQIITTDSADFSIYSRFRSQKVPVTSEAPPQPPSVNPNRHQ